MTDGKAEVQFSNKREDYELKDVIGKSITEFHPVSHSF